ncbi:MAG: hypothetical protein RL021_247 [Bacteroidota bacterium]|jgi:hypothetical protein
MKDDIRLQPDISARRAWPAPVSYLFLFFVYASTFRIFATLPAEKVHFLLSSTGIILFSCYYLGSLYIKSGSGQFTRLDVLVCVFLAINFFAAIRAHAVFGQPYLYGLIAQRTVLLVLSGSMIVSFLEKGWVTIRQLERSFLFLAAGLLVVTYCFVLFADPKKFVDEEFVVYSPLRGYRFRFQFALVIMLYFYSLIKWLECKRRAYLFVVLAIVFYLVYFLQSRTTLVMLSVSSVIYLYKSFSAGWRVKRLLLFALILGMTVSVFYLLGLTSVFDRYRVLFTNATDLFRGVSPDEASSAIRFIELKTAMNWIQKHPLLGNGFISSQWEGGWHRILGYFYPVDIGIFGNLFVFGIIGTLLVYVPFLYGFSLSVRVPTTDVFCKTCSYTLLFFFLTMFFSAVNIRDSPAILFLVCIVYYYRYNTSPDVSLTPSDSHALS